MPLLERGSEIAAVDAALASARAGSGAVLVVEGPAGIGKTAIVEEARGLAERVGASVRVARGGSLEREIAHGVARQLLEPPLRAAAPELKAALMAGAASLAAPVVFHGSEAGASLPDGPATDLRAPVVHGLYWLTANLAAIAPLLLAVDDAQWCDAASLRFLNYLARRLDGLPVVVLLTIRTGEPAVEQEALSELTMAASARVLRPAPLSERAIDELVRASLDGEPEKEFVTVCRQATGGIPYLLKELFAALSSRGVHPSAAAAASVTRVTSETVAHATVLRLSRLAAASTPVAQCVAILGRRADLRHVAGLSGLDDGAVLLGHDALVGANILRPGRPMEFVHPIVRASIYDAMPAGQRAVAHTTVARILLSEGADPEEIAGHVLLVEPGRTADFLDPLRAAAESALRRGAPESAAAYLRRALPEATTPGTRARVLFELGCAETLTRDPSAVARLEEAHRVAAEPELRAAVVAQLAPALGFLGRLHATGRMIRAAIDELGDEHVALAAELEAGWATVAAFDPALVDNFDQRRASLVALAARAGIAGRPLSLVLAGITAYRGDHLEAVMPLVDRGLDGGRVVAEAGSQSWTLAIGGQALVLVDELEAARRLSHLMLEDAQRRGSAFGFEAASALRAFVHNQSGDLAAGEADLRVALGTSAEQGIVVRTVGTLYQCIDILVERARLDDVAAMVETFTLEPELRESAHGAMLLETRGWIRLADGRLDAAIDDLRSSGRLMEAVRWRNPVDSQWRSALALALPPGNRSEAAGLVADELALARATGLPRPVGAALRASGLIEGGGRGLDLLRESVDVLERSPARLESARSQVELGAALRRANQRSAAREPLRAGLDLALRCGADRLAARAEDELRATGAKPRRRALSGLDALTPNERRVARHAASGMSNREIAQALFVTTKTVETQLSTAYAKLGIRGRDELAARIEAEVPPG
jgi:DNA-binding CsgD family transcriptional regulator